MRNYPHMSRDQCEQLSSLSPTSSTYTDESDKKGAFLFFCVDSTDRRSGEGRWEKRLGHHFFASGASDKAISSTCIPKKNGTLISTKKHEDARRGTGIPYSRQQRSETYSERDSTDKLSMADASGNIMSLLLLFITRVRCSYTLYPAGRLFSL